MWYHGGKVSFGVRHHFLVMEAWIIYLISKYQKSLTLKFYFTKDAESFKKISFKPLFLKTAGKVDNLYNHNIS